jgi:periplasmic divalent cation tolerance protein
MDEAKRIGKLLVDQKSAACVQFWEVGSMFVWEGEFKAVKEVAMCIKTFESKLQEIEDLISNNHSYSVPEIAAVDIKRIYRPYKEWMQQIIL